MARETEFDLKAPADEQAGIALTAGGQDEYLQPRFGLIHTSSWFSTADWAMGSSAAFVFTPGGVACFQLIDLLSRRRKWQTAEFFPLPV